MKIHRLIPVAPPAADLLSPRIATMPRHEIRAAMERVADRLIECGEEPRRALALAYESMLRVAARQSPPV